jgi:hypothetical protein
MSRRIAAVLPSTRALLFGVYGARRQADMGNWFRPDRFRHFVMAKIVGLAWPHPGPLHAGEADEAGREAGGGFLLLFFKKEALALAFALLV